MQKYVEYNFLLLINLLALLFLTHANKHDIGGILNHLFDAVEENEFFSFLFSLTLRFLSWWM
jgi:hypothetical protein